MNIYSQLNTFIDPITCTIIFYSMHVNCELLYNMQLQENYFLSNLQAQNNDEIHHPPLTQLPQIKAPTLLHYHIMYIYKCVAVGVTAN